MRDYKKLLEDILQNGVEKDDRTGVGSRSVFGRTLRFNLSDGFPILTTRKVSLKVAFEETMFFLRGHQDTKLLEEKNVNIWKGNTTREFLDNRGLDYLPEGDFGRSYGVQWRDWKSVDKGGNTVHVDQINDLLKGLAKDPNSRRHVVTAWNPGELNQMALPPCHLMHMYSAENTFSHDNGKLNSCFVMRSTDAYLGLPFNCMSYSLLNHIFAKYLGMTPGEVVYFGWDVHLYNNQLDVVKEQLTRDHRKLPELIIKKELNSFQDILDLQFDDLELIGYDPHPPLKKVEMAI